MYFRLLMLLVTDKLCPYICRLPSGASPYGYHERLNNWLTLPSPSLAFFGGKPFEINFVLIFVYL